MTSNLSFLVRTIYSHLHFQKDFSECFLHFRILILKQAKSKNFFHGYSSILGNSNGEEQLGLIAIKLFWKSFDFGSVKFAVELDPFKVSSNLNKSMTVRLQ